MAGDEIDLWRYLRFCPPVSPPWHDLRWWRDKEEDNSVAGERGERSDHLCQPAHFELEIYILKVLRPRDVSLLQLESV